MLFQSNETARIVDAIRRGAKQWTQAELGEVLSLARARKPSAQYDDESRGIAMRYAGQQREIIAAKLARRYPNAVSDFPIAPKNWLRYVANADAGVYSEPAERVLVDENGATSTDEDKQARLRALVKSCDLDVHLAELERRTIIGGTTACLVSWQQDRDSRGGGELGVTMFWPHDTVALSAVPGDQSTLYVAGLRIASLDVTIDSEWWWVWSRVPIVDDAGELVGFGPWHHVRVSTAGDQAGSGPAPTMYPGSVLPICFARLGARDGSIYSPIESDLISVVDELNVSGANEQYTLDLQGHTQGWYQGTSIEQQNIALGPDRLVKILPGESIGTIGFDPALADMREGRKLALRELAVSRGNAPDQYTIEPGAPLSGVSRQIANIPHDQRIASLRSVFRRFEEKLLLPAIVDVHDTFSGAEPIGPASFAVRHAPAREYEDREAKQRRLEVDLSRDVISEARYAVEMGHYPSTDAAVAAGLSAELRRARAAQGIGERIAAGMAKGESDV